MELFHEYHNRFFMALVELAERIASGEKISSVEFDRIYYEIGSGGRKRIGETFLEKVKHNTKLELFDFSDKNSVKLNISTDSTAEIANIPLKVERVWCEAALCDHYTQLFFDEDETEQYREKIADRSFPYYDLIDNSACDMTAEEVSAVQPVFQQVLNAIMQTQDVQFVYANETVSGTPLRIVYDENGTQFSLLMKRRDSIEIYALTRISNFQVIGIAAKRETTVKDIMAPYKAAEPIIFEVTDEKNRRAIERALITFSVYDHIVRILDDKKVEITINYYQFDQEDVIRRILSFGTDALIKSPPAAIEHIKKILKSI